MGDTKRRDAKKAALASTFIAAVIANQIHTPQEKKMDRAELHTAG